MTVDHFYSDPHFGHAAVIGYSQRPFLNAGQMNDDLMRRYNACVGKKDIVLWLGDCFFTSTDIARNIMAQLNGRKLLVRGNHDRSASAMARLGFDIVTDHLTMCIAGKKVIASHYPYVGSVSPEDAAPNAAETFTNRPVRNKDQVLLHGHTHSKQRYHQGMVHVGVDAWDYAPVPMAEVERLVRG